MGRRVTRVLCVGDPRGDGAALERLHDVAGDQGVQAIAVVGDLSAGGDKDSYRTVFKALGTIGLPTFWVPGANDAPIERYLREAHNMEIVFPFLHGVHGTVAFADGHVLFAGIGGEIDDDPDAARDEHGRLRYPRWEAEYRLKLIRELDEHQIVMAFWNPPAHKGSGRPGSEAVTELIATYRPRLVICSGEPGSELIGRSLIVSPGSLADGGHYAIADLHGQDVELGTISVTA
jgi:prepilin-type processing-associated H-X9-DG protein